MKIKKLPRYLALTMLTSGASIILGFLSFGGTYALWPILPLAFSAFGLSVAYEGEIYLQNIKGSLDKLFKRDHLKHQLANEFLLQNIPDDFASEGCPSFFKDYVGELRKFQSFGHEHLDKARAIQKKHIEKSLKDMEKWFAQQLFQIKKGGEQKSSPYAQELQIWLAMHQQQEWQAKLNKQRLTFSAVKGFSLLAGAFMSLGTTYLLVEAFSVIPALSALSFTMWPMLIVPMAVIAGTAYGLLTYNAVTDMISNDTIRKWFNKIREDFKQGLTIRNAFTAATAMLLVSLALALTICTAGTWWTVAEETAPLFSWLNRMPNVIMGVINPIITGLSAVVFNLENSAESLELIDEATRPKKHASAGVLASIKHRVTHVLTHENALQVINPFRLLLKLTITPLRIVLFLGHLVSIGLTADRVPGIPQIISALLGIISEGFEDFHYFVSHDHEHHTGQEGAPLSHKDLLNERLSKNHGHNHDLDLPTRLLKIIFSPLYVLAAGWDSLFSQANDLPKKPLDFVSAWRKQTHTHPEGKASGAEPLEQPSISWQTEHAIYRMERFKEKHLDHVWVNRERGLGKSRTLTALQNDLKERPPVSQEALKSRLDAAGKEPIYNTHRLFSTGKTRSATFIEDLPKQIIGMS